MQLKFDVVYYDVHSSNYYYYNSYYYFQDGWVKLKPADIAT